MALDDLLGSQAVMKQLPGSQAGIKQTRNLRPDSVIDFCPA